MVELKITRLDKTVDMPFYAYEHDAAFDLRSSHDEVLNPGDKKIIKTALKMAIPQNHVGLIWDRSGLAAKHSLHCLAGVIDSGYRGEIGVVLINLGKEDFKIEKNMRIAQMLIQPIVNAKITEVEENELEESKRGEGGFGSSGIK
jgi:dUTP pyrophosphatase